MRNQPPSDFTLIQAAAEWLLSIFDQLVKDSVERQRLLTYATPARGVLRQKDAAVYFSLSVNKLKQLQRDGKIKGISR